MRLAAALARLRQRLFDAAGAGARFSGGGGVAVALLAVDGRILDLSESAARLFAEAGAAPTLAGLFLAEDRPAVEQAVRSKAVVRLEARARRPGGATALIELRLERRPDGRAVALLIDRTSEDAERRRAADQARAARAEAAEAATMLADLSHEMRTPLNAVIGFAETIERQTFGPVGHPNYAQYAEHIRLAGRHLLDLVETALDLSRIESDRRRLQRVATDPAALARECASIIRLAAEAAGLSLVVDAPDGLPPCALDPKAVRQILLNLLGNAVKFTSDGEVGLAVRRDGEAIVFTVWDDGVGMSAEALKKIGARFTSAQGAGVRGQGGAGLGLALAFGLAELHGGRIDLSSAPGEGLRADVRLPIAGDDAAKGAVRAQLAAIGARADPGESPPSQLDRIQSRLRRARAAA
jgi:cell cycle sensor histidine kinase DivJ